MTRPLDLEISQYNACMNCDMEKKSMWCFSKSNDDGKLTMKREDKKPNTADIGLLDPIVIQSNGQKVKLMGRYIRHTLNPVAPKYPKTGDRINIKGHQHPLIKDGEYIVEMVEEWEPPCDADDDGRDIRIKLLSVPGGGWDGPNIMKAMVV